MPWVSLQVDRRYTGGLGQVDFDKDSNYETGTKKRLMNDLAYFQVTMLPSRKMLTGITLSVNIACEFEESN